MLFYSTLIKTHVYNSNDEKVGKVSDICIEAKDHKEFPSLKAVLVETKNDGKVLIDSMHIAAWSHEGINLRNDLKESLSSFSEGDLLFLGKTILDRQIVDLDGVKVVRVNDLQVGPVRGLMSLLAIDVSNGGLFRRLGLGFLTKLFKPHFLQWKNIHLIGDKIKLGIGKEKLTRLHPADIANIVEKLNINQGSQLLRSLDQSTAAKVLEEIRPDIQKILVRNLGADRAAVILEKMSMDELVDLIQLLPTRESKELIEKLPAQKNVAKVKKILEYDEDEAGGLMTTEFISAHMDTKISDVIEQIRRDSHQHRAIHFVYVTDDKGRYLGVASLRRIILAKPTQKIKEISKGVKRAPVVNVTQGVTEIASILTKYNLLSVAVVDEKKKLLGIVTVDDIMRCLVPKA